VEGKTRESRYYYERLMKFHKRLGARIKTETIGNTIIDFLTLKDAVIYRGGYEMVSNQKLWRDIALNLNLTSKKAFSIYRNPLELIYTKWIEPFEKFSQSFKESVNGNLAETAILEESMNSQIPRNDETIQTNHPNLPNQAGKYNEKRESVDNNLPVVRMDIDGPYESDDSECNLDKERKCIYHKTMIISDENVKSDSQFSSNIPSKIDFFIEDNIFSLRGDEVYSL
jgi:hypothetical protein